MPKAEKRFLGADPDLAEGDAEGEGDNKATDEKIDEKADDKVVEATVVEVSTSSSCDLTMMIDSSTK
jgi:hypothetical protein